MIVVGLWFVLALVNAQDEDRQKICVGDVKSTKSFMEAEKFQTYLTYPGKDLDDCARQCFEKLDFCYSVRFDGEGGKCLFSYARLPCDESKLTLESTDTHNLELAHCIACSGSVSRPVLQPLAANVKTKAPIKTTFAVETSTAPIAAETSIAPETSTPVQDTTTIEATSTPEPSTLKTRVFSLNTKALETTTAATEPPTTTKIIATLGPITDEPSTARTRIFVLNRRTESSTISTVAAQETTIDAHTPETTVARTEPSVGRSSLDPRIAPASINLIPLEDVPSRANGLGGQQPVPPAQPVFIPEPTTTTINPDILPRTRRPRPLPDPRVVVPLPAINNPDRPSFIPGPIDIQFRTRRPRPLPDLRVTLPPATAAPVTFQTIPRDTTATTERYARFTWTPLQFVRFRDLEPHFISLGNEAEDREYMRLNPVRHRKIN